PLGPVGPAHVVDRNLRAVHPDAVDLAELEWAALANVADGVERRVIAADAGIEFQRNPHRLPFASQAFAQGLEIEAVLRAREGGAESAIRRLENVGDAGEPTLGEERAVEPALRGAAGMHPLDHGAILRRHQAGGLRAGDAERMHG